MASPYYTKQPVYLEDPSRRFGSEGNILSNFKLDPIEGGFDREIPEYITLSENPFYRGKDFEGFGENKMRLSKKTREALASRPTLKDYDLGPTRLNFPFTPTISVIQSANYNSYDFDHSNFQQRAFVSHSNMELNITAPMLVRSDEEAEYVYNAATWLRSTMKMQWAKDDNPGQPPPILRFNAHGIYDNIPCVVRDFTWNLDSDIDYVETNGMRVPVMNMFVLSLTVSYSPKSIREKFSVKDYLAGNLKGEGYV